MKVLLSPCHYVFEAEVGSELSWAYNIGDRVGRLFPSSVVVTGRNNVLAATPYRVVEAQRERTRVDFSIGNAALFNWRYFRATRELLGREPFDVVHHVLPFSVGSTFNLTVLLQPRTPTPFIVGPVQARVAVRDSDRVASDFGSFRSAKTHGRAEVAAQAVASPLLRRLSRSTLRKAFRIVAVNEAARDMLTGFGIDPARVVVIPPGVDCDRLRPANFDAPDRAGLVTAGYLLRRKGTELILSALRRVVESFPEITLTVVGDGPQRASLISLARELGLARNVDFVGFVPWSDIGAYYHRAVAFVSMSHWESWGQVYTEAMAAGLPVLAARNPGSQEIVRDGETGFLVDEGNSEMLAAKIVDVLASPPIARRLGDQASRLAEDRYDWGAIIPQYVSLYETAVRESVHG